MSYLTYREKELLHYLVEEYTNRKITSTIYYLKPSMLVIILIRTIDSIKLSYDLVYTLTQGGPGIATEMISYFLYVIGFKQFFIGKASAGSYLLLIVMILVSMFFIKILKGEYEKES